SLLQLLREPLGWPIEPDALIDDISFEWDAHELRVHEKQQAYLKDGIVRQLRPFTENQPWGVFIVEFNEPRVYRTALRQVLRGLVPSRRRDSSLPAWQHENLLFICTTRDYQRFTFAHFRGDRPHRATLARFEWERGDPHIRTLCEFNLPCLRYPEPSTTPEQWLNKWRAAFDVEALTEQFYREFRELFEQAEQQIARIADPDQKRLFTLKLFNRLLFVRFLERKGWLRFDKQRNYLRALWEDYQASRAEGDTFYNARLKPLFFSALNNPQQRNLMAMNQGGLLREIIGDAPYLNGGLFEPGADDQNAHVPDEALRPLIENLLYRYNFTITESTPLEIEVAVDPEMLGKVFEELVTGRHESGSYYTPRPVVAFMCREALKGYLQSTTGEDTEALTRFVDQRDASALKDPEKTLDALRRVRVCDPACGSGAYLLGMLHELLELRSALFEQKHLDPRTLYDRKLEIIQRNLYGVDIDPFAVEIARLRLWLSLVVDDPRNPLDDPDADVSLPNLDFKIEAGDSLLAPDPQGGQQPDMFRQQQIEEYERLKADYMRAHSNEQKRVLRERIQQLRDEIRQWAHPKGGVEGFDWRVEFAEVFKDGGFDIIVANPPYVRADAQYKHIENETERQAAIQRWKAYRKKLADSGHYKTLYEKWDLYIPFLERAYQLLRPEGHMVFIISDAYNTAKYAQKSHEFFLENTQIERIDFCSDIDLFDAGVNNTILHFSKRKPAPDHRPVRVRRWGESREEFSTNLEYLTLAPQSSAANTLFRPKITESTSLSVNTVPLDKICYISVGMVIHADENKAHLAFRKQDLISDKKDRKHPKPYVEGKDILRWWVPSNRYLEYGTERAPRLFRRPTFPQLYEVPEKLIAVGIVGNLTRVAYDNRQLYHNHSAWSFVPWRFLKGVVNQSISKTAKYRKQSKIGDREQRELLSEQFEVKYLLAIMNSSFAAQWLAQKRRSKLSIYPDDWKQLPVVVISKEEQQEFVRLVDAILAEFQQHGYPLPPEAAARVAQLEREIDEKVKRLYRV
ncbi:MAG: DNA methyltransferase, partial [Candidatus Caldarchaeum sp.]